MLRNAMDFLIQTSIFIFTNISQAACWKEQKYETGDRVIPHDEKENRRKDNILTTPNSNSPGLPGKLQGPNETLNKAYFHTESSNAHLDQHRPHNCENSGLQPPCGKNAPIHDCNPHKKAPPTQQDETTGYVVQDVQQDDTPYCKKAPPIPVSYTHLTLPTKRIV